MKGKKATWACWATGQRTSNPSNFVGIYFTYVHIGRYTPVQPFTMGTSLRGPQVPYVLPWHLGQPGTNAGEKSYPDVLN